MSKTWTFTNVSFMIYEFHSVSKLYLAKLQAKINTLSNMGELYALDFFLIITDRNMDCNIFFTVFVFLSSITTNFSSHFIILHYSYLRNYPMCTSILQAALLDTYWYCHSSLEHSKGPTNICNLQQNSLSVLIYLCVSYYRQKNSNFKVIQWIYATWCNNIKKTVLSRCFIRFKENKDTLVILDLVKFLFHLWKEWSWLFKGQVLPLGR